MSENYDQSPLPSRHAVRSLIQDLLGRDVQLTDQDPVPAKTTNIIAVYVNDRVQTSSVIVATLECAARLGGALGMLPKGGVEDCIDERELTGLIRDNAYEVLNVLASIFNITGAPHVRLYEMYGPDEPPPPDIANLAYAAGGRLDVILSIAGYGEGSMSIVIR